VEGGGGRLLSLVIIFLVFSLYACHTPQKTPDAISATDSMQYATGFTVSEQEDYTVVDVRDPWRKERLLQRYILVPREKPLPANLPEGTVIKTPIQHAIVYSSVHCAMLDEIGAMDCVTGVCDYEYIRLEAVKTRYQSGKIQDMGVAVSPNVEKIIASGAEVILSTPFENGSYGAVEKIGIPIIECSDYMETKPLGRAEWIRFFGLLTGRTEKADSSFRETSDKYLKYKLLAENANDRPTLLVGMKYGAPWYVASGESFMARIFDDAGADYIFRDLPGAGGTPLSFETVLDKAVHADFWLILYNNNQELTYKSLKSDFTSYSQFDAFKNQHIYGCNTNFSTYYEEMPVHPDRLLAELVAIFHPELAENYDFRYFLPLK
jgi:iron complex transport system substrate-binding protein